MTVFVVRIGQVIGVETAITRLPGFAAVTADIDAADADAGDQMAAVARIDHDGTAAGMIAPGRQTSACWSGGTRAFPSVEKNRRRHR